MESIRAALAGAAGMLGAASAGASGGLPGAAGAGGWGGLGGLTGAAGLKEFPAGFSAPWFLLLLLALPVVYLLGRRAQRAPKT
ncbi:MAG TPA: hypothetical protein VH257_23460, partial [Chloroflexota bacterium]|nr:hypothetical protein [Chloroflexota bacterium]